MNQPAPKTLDRSAHLFKSLADPVRLRLLNLLGDGREVCVCHLHGALDLPQPTVSRHLAYLRKAGLVVGRKEGLWVHYRLAKPAGTLQQALVDCLHLADAQTFERDRKRLADSRACCISD